MTLITIPVVDHYGASIVFQIRFETQVVGQAAGLSAQAGRLGHQFIVQNPNHYLNVYSISLERVREVVLLALTIPPPPFLSQSWARKGAHAGLDQGLGLHPSPTR